MAKRPAARVSGEYLKQSQPWIRQLAAQLVSSGYCDLDPDDLAQDVILRALRSRHKPVAPRSWIRYLVRRTGERLTLQEKERRALEQKAATNHDASLPIDDATQDEASRLILAAIQRLRKPHRSTILAFFYEGLSTRQIASRDGVSFQAVALRINTALADLRRDLESQFGDDRRRWRSALLPLLAFDKGGVQLSSLLGLKGVVAAMMALVLIPATVVVLGLLDQQDPPRKPVAEQARVEEAHSGNTRRSDLVEPHEKAAKEPRELANVPPQRVSKLVTAGRVTDQFGNPIDGIWIKAAGPETHYAFSDREGRYQIPCVRGRYTLSVTPVSDHSCSGWSRWFVEDRKSLPRKADVDAGATVDFRITIESAVDGVLVDSAGKPLAMAVFPHLKEGERIRETMPGLKTGVDGRFTILFAKPRKLDLAFKPCSENYVVSPFQTVELQPAFIHRGTRFVFQTGGIITGAIRNASGKKLPIVKIEAIDTSTLRLAGLCLVLPSPNPHYKICGLPDGEFEIRITPFDGPRSTIPNLSVTAGTEVRRDIVIPDGGRIRPVVVDASSGTPIQSFEITYRRSDRNIPTPVTCSSTDGRLTFEKSDANIMLDLAPGHYSISVVVGTRTCDREVDVVAGKCTDVVFRLGEKP